MRPSRPVALVVLLALVALVGCDAAPGPGASGSPTGSTGLEPSSALEPVDFVTEQLRGQWRRSPIILDDAHIAIISDACAAAARQKLGEVEANLPTALVDARGEHIAMA